MLSIVQIRKKRRALGCLVSFGAAWGGLLGADEASEEKLPAPSALLERYCFECHGEKRREADLSLLPSDRPHDPLEAPWFWRSVLEQIEEEEMPPESPYPTAVERQALTRWLRKSLDGIDWRTLGRPGRVTASRMTREEYRNTMRDLFGTDFRAGEGFPVEGEGGSGFSNDRDSLVLSPALTQRYLDEAERVVEAAFALGEASLKKRWEAEEMEVTSKWMTPFEEGILLVHPGYELQANVSFPADGEYELRVRTRLSGKPSALQWRVDGDVVAEAAVNDEAAGIVTLRGYVRRGHRTLSLQAKNLVPQVHLPDDIVDRVNRWAEERQARLDPLTESESEEVKIAREGLNHRSWALQEAHEWLRVLGPDADPREIDRFRRYIEEREAGTEPVRDNLAEKLEITRNALDALWAQENREVLEGNARIREAVAHVRWDDWQYHQGQILADWLEINGPVGKVALVDRWRADEPVEDLLSDWLQQVFRRPIDGEEVGRYTGFFRRALSGGMSRDEAFRWTLVATLVSPEFLLRREWEGIGEEEKPAMGAEVVALDDYALASRLSYFLWLSMPDERLFELAVRGRMRDPDVLASEAVRLLNDPRAGAFADAFVDAWMGLGSLESDTHRDWERFPSFSPELAASMRKEAVLTFQDLLVENHQLTGLLESDRIFVDERLARHYQLPDVRGEDFRAVSVGDAPRGGVLGMASFLTATSSATRTNPARRGTWVLERLLGDSVGEPLPDAGELPPDAGERKGATLRDAFALHLTREDCRRCHERIDPIGLGLQNFDAIGGWREDEAGGPIDASGRMPDGTPFNGPGELKQALLERRDEVIRHLGGQVLSFALGRDLQKFDEPALDRILEQVRAEDYRAHALIQAVVTSDAFRYREP